MRRVLFLSVLVGTGCSRTMDYTALEQLCPDGSGQSSVLVGPVDADAPAVFRADWGDLIEEAGQRVVIRPAEAAIWFAGDLTVRWSLAEPEFLYRLTDCTPPAVAGTVDADLEGVVSATIRGNVRLWMTQEGGVELAAWDGSFLLPTPESWAGPLAERVADGAAPDDVLMSVFHHPFPPTGRDDGLTPSAGVDLDLIAGWAIFGRWDDGRPGELLVEGGWSVP